MRADTHPKPAGAWTRRWGALIGLLGVAIALGVAVIVAAWQNYRGMESASWAVRRQRAAEVANAFAATVRAARVLGDPGQMQRIAQETSDEDLEIEVLRVDGHTVAASDAKRVGRSRTLPTDLLQELRLQEGVFRQRMGSVVYFRAIGKGRGRRFGGRGRGPGMWRWKGGGGRFSSPWRGRFRRHGRIVRVKVGPRVGAGLVATARINLAVSSAVVGILLLVAVVMFQMARRARRAERTADKQRALASLGEMAAVLAHEIRTPLGSIKGNAQLLDEERGDTRATAIVNEAGRLERLVNGMLDYARPAPPQPAPLDPNQLMERSAEIVAPIAIAKGVTLMTEPVEAKVALEADGDQLLQVLVNLMQNAVEATEALAEDQLRPPVVVGVHQRGGGVVFVVRDGGAGFSGSAEGLFKPFLSTKRKGSGLGLAVSRQIIEQHGGRVELRRRDEGGAVAEVWLPLTGEGAEQ